MATALIPWRPGCPHREAALAWVTDRYREIGVGVVTGTAPPGPWCKARAITNALTCTNDDTLIVADADVWTDGIPQALEGLQDHAWAIPHLHVYRLSQTATRGVLDGSPADLSDLDNVAYYGTQGGGVVALHRDTWNAVPMDPRFEGWGGEDHAWGIALHHLAGKPWIGRADLIHLWHPPQDDAPDLRGPSGARSRPKIPNKANFNLNHRYRDAKVSRSRMQALVDEAREALCRTPVS